MDELTVRELYWKRCRAQLRKILSRAIDIDNAGQVDEIAYTGKKEYEARIAYESLKCDTLADAISVSMYQCPDNEGPVALSNTPETPIE